MSNHLPFLPVLLFVVLLFAPGNPQQGDQAVFLSSQSRYGGLDIAFDETTQNFTLTRTPDYNVLTFSGLNGLATDFVITLPVTDDFADLNDTVQDLQFRVQMADIVTTVTTQDYFYVPYGGGQMIIDTYSEFEDTQQTVIADLVSRYVQQTTSSGSGGGGGGGSRRKRGAEAEEKEEANENEKKRTGKRSKNWFTGALPFIAARNYDLSPTRDQEKEDEILQMLLFPGIHPAQILYRQVDPETKSISFLHSYEVPLKQKILLLQRGEFQVAELTDDAKESIEQRNSRKRSIIGTVFAKDQTKELWDEVGGACDAVRYGAGIIAGIKDICYQDTMSYIDGKVDAIGDDVATLNAQMGLVVDALNLTANALETISGIQKIQQEQVGLLQEQVNILHTESINTNLKFNDLSRVANQQAFANELLQASDAKLASSVTRLEGVVAYNLGLVDQALGNMGEMVNNQNVAMQSQMLEIEQTLNAQSSRQTKQIMTEMARQVNQINKNINLAVVDIDSRLAIQSQRLAGAIDESRQISAENQAQLILHANALEDFYTVISQIFLLQFYKGDLDIKYWLYKRVIETAQNGTYMPLVLEGTGVPPPNMTAYVVGTGRRTTFTEVGVNTCQITTPQYTAIQATIQASLKQNAILTALVPIGIHPDYLHYAFLASQATSVPITAVDRYYISWSLHTNLPAVPYPTVAYNASANLAPGAISGNYVMILDTSSTNPCAYAWIPDTPQNRLNPSTVLFMMGAATVDQMVNGIVNDGELTYFYGIFGSTICQMIQNTGTPATTFNITFIPAITSRGSNTLTTRVRHVETSTEASALAFLQQQPFGQKDLATLILYDTANPRSTPYITLDTSLFPPALPTVTWNSTTTQNLYVSAISFTMAIPASNSSLIQGETNLNEGEYNATLTGQFDVPVTRKKRFNDVTRPPSFLDCYSGLTIEASTPASYGVLSSDAQARANTCASKPGCQFVVAVEPKVILAFQNPDFTGTVQQINPQPAATINFGSQSFRSLIIPPYYTANVYAQPIPPTSQICQSYSFTCRWRVQTCICTTTAILNSKFKTEPESCAYYYGFTNGDRHVWGWEHTNPDVLALEAPDYLGTFSGRKNMCQDMGLYNYKSQFCSLYDTPDNDPLGRDNYRSTTATSTQANIDQCKSRVGPGNTYKGYLTEGRNVGCDERPISQINTVINVDATNFTCAVCKPGYGNVNTGAAGPGGDCTPTGFNTSAGFGGPSGPFFYVTNPAYVNVPIRVTNVAGTRTWQTCQPFQDGVTQATQAVPYPGYSVPYLFTPGDLPAAGFAPPNGVNIYMSVGDCTLYSQVDCVADGQRAGFCSLQVDPNLTTPSPIPSLLGQSCQYVSKDPCPNATSSITACLATTLNSSTGVAVPVCQWNNDKGGICEALSASSIGSNRVYPSNAAGANPTISSISIACVYRDATLASRCNYDGNCYQVGQIGATGNYLCLPMTPAETAFIENTSVMWSQASLYGSLLGAQNLLNTTLPTFAASTCFSALNGFQNQCNLRSLRWTLRLYSIFTAATPSSALPYCNSFPATGTSCHSLIVTQVPSYTGAFISDDYAQDAMVPSCTSSSGTCTQNCYLLGTNMDACLNTLNGECFVSATNYQCYDNTGANRNLVCPGNPQSPFQQGSNCITNGNACNLIPATQQWTGSALTNISFNVNGSTTPSSYLQTSVCALATGSGTGNITILSHAYPGVQFPVTTLQQSCTAVMDATGSSQCTPSSIVGYCPIYSDYCDLYTDLADQIIEYIQQSFCDYQTIGACLTSTKDQVTFPCAWIQTTTVYGYCALKEDAAYVENFGNQNIQTWTFESYQIAKQFVAVEVTATYNGFMVLGLNPTLFKISSLVAFNMNSDVLLLGPARIPCPQAVQQGVPQDQTGFVCCLDSACSEFIPNPNHPKQVFINLATQICEANSINIAPVESEIFYAGKEVPYADPATGTILNAYVVEPFIPPSSHQRLFNFNNPDERGSETVYLTPTMPLTLTPVKFYPSNTTQGTPSSVYRTLAPPVSVAFLNTLFTFDGVTNITSDSLENARYFDTRNISDNQLATTQAILNSMGGVYPVFIAPAYDLQATMNSDIRIFTGSKTALFGPNPQSWNTRADFGATQVSYPAGTGPDGSAVAKRDRLITAYVNKNFNVPVKLVVETRVDAVATITMVDGTVIYSGTVDFTNSYAGLLPQVGDVFIHHVVNNKLVSIGQEEIGRGTPYKIGYVWSPTQTSNFDFAAFMPVDWNAGYATNYPYLYQSDVIPGAEPGSIEYLCGNNIIFDSSKVGDIQVRLNLLMINLNYDVLSDEQKAFWNDTIDVYGLAAVENMDILFKQIWLQVGCVTDLVNYVEGMLDIYRVLTLNCFNVSTASYDTTCLTNTITNDYFNPANRIQCGNCIILTDVSYVSGVGQPTTYKSVNICNPAYGTEPYLPAPSLALIDSVRTSQSFFCAAASFHNITENHVSPTVTEYVMTLQPGLIPVTVTFSSSTLLADKYIQVSSSSLCPVPTQAATYSSPTSGVYQLSLSNPYPFSLPFIVKLRQNITWLDVDYGTTPGDSCNSDEVYSVKGYSNLTLFIPVCPLQTYYLQVATSNGDACSIVFEGTNDYTAYLSNSSAIISYYKAGYSNNIVNASNALDDSIYKLNQQLNVKINLTDSKLTDSIYQVNSSLGSIANTTATLVTQTLNQQSAIVNIDGRVSHVETGFVVINSSLTDISAEQRLISDTIASIRNDTAQLQNATAESLVQLAKIDVLAEMVANNSIAAAAKIAQLDATIENLKTLVTQISELRVNDSKSLQDIADNENASSWIIWVVLAVALAVGLGVVGYLIYVCVSKQKMASAAKGLANVATSAATSSIAQAAMQAAVNKSGTTSLKEVDFYQKKTPQAMRDYQDPNEDIIEMAPLLVPVPVKINENRAVRSSRDIVSLISGKKRSEEKKK